MFTRITSLENVVLTTDTTGQTVTLGTLAVAAGVVSVSAAAVTTNTRVTTIDLSGMTGSAGVAVTGGAGADTILGSAGNDTINGGTAGKADIITGGAGADRITIGATGASVIKININADVAAGTTLANADQITGLTTTVNKIDLAGTTLMSTGGTVLPLTNGADSGLAGAGVAYVSGAAAGFANLASVANQQGLIFEVSDSTLSGAGNTLLTAAGIANAVTFITTNIATTTVQNTNVFIIVNDAVNSALFYYQEGALDQGIQASELTLVGVFVANDGTTGLVSGDFI